MPILSRTSLVAALLALHLPGNASAQGAPPAGSPAAPPSPASIPTPTPTTPTSTSTPTTAAPAPAASATGADRLDELDQKIRVIERRWEVDQEIAADKADKQRQSPPGSALASPKDGFALKSADGNFVLRIRGLVHADQRTFIEGGANTFLLRRVRPSIEGTVYKFFDFRIYPELASPMSILDAWGNVRILKELQLKVGKFKGPVGLERLQSPNDITFVERGLPTNLVPNRDIGIQLHGELFEGAVAYQAGIFNGVGDGQSGDLDNNDQKDLMGRLFLKPFVSGSTEALAGLGVGLSASRGTHVGALPVFRTAGQNAFFQYASSTFAAGTHKRLSPQATYYFGPLGILGEYVLSTQIVTRDNQVYDTVRHRSWQVGASVFLTGETASFTTVTPKRTFDPENGTFGAIEITGRYGTLSIDDGAFSAGYADPSRSARAAKAWAAGINWYLAKAYRIQANYEQTTFDGGAAQGQNRPIERAVLTRLQAVF